MPHENVVYLVDPDESIGHTLSKLLQAHGVIVRNYADAESFLEVYTTVQREQGCLLVAKNLAGMSGLALVGQLREQGLCLPVIVTAEKISSDFRAHALKMGATEVIEKPLMHGFLLERLRVLFPGGSTLSDPTANCMELSDGTRISFRVMRPEDAAIERDFITALSAKSRHSRFFSNIKQLPAAVVEKFTHPKYPESYALMATIQNGDKERQIGVARYVPTDNKGTAEFAIVVADEWQGQGIATKLLRGLTTTAAVAGIKRLEGLVLRDNTAMRHLAQSQGFSFTRCAHDAAVLCVSKSLYFPGDCKKEAS